MLKKQLNKTYTSFRPLLFSRHPSHQALRTRLSLLPFRSLIRLGSTTNHTRDRVECNNIQGVKNSANKLLMKKCFTRAGVKTANWWTYSCGVFIKNNIGEQGCDINNLPYPIVAKSLLGSRGTGNYKLDTQESLQEWMREKDLYNYIFEEFYTYSREYRLHIGLNGCFYTCRKLLKPDAPDNTWQRHDDVCSWALESNPSFKKPLNWNEIVEDCVKAKNALGLDICAFDVMVQGAKDRQERTNPEWIILESCSAPSFGDITLQKYIEEIPKILKHKHASRR